PYKLPVLSMITPAYGYAPLVPLNEASAVIAPLPLASSKTVPTWAGPPPSVVPYRLPLLSMITAAYGHAPLVPLNETSAVRPDSVIRSSSCSRGSGIGRGRCGPLCRARRKNADHQSTGETERDTYRMGHLWC